MQSKHNNAHFNTLLNGSFPSVKDYFNQSSNGNYAPQFDVFGPYTLPQTMSYYGSNNSQGDDKYPGQMVVDACAEAYADGCNFSNYDVDNDGVVDNVYVIYAGYGEASGAASNTIWPHSWALYPGTNYVSGTTVYNGKTISHYACSSELNGTSGTEGDGVGTFAHEFSHVIGLPDYYDTEYGNNYYNGLTPGYWSLMDGGSYNGDGQYPPLYSIFDQYFMKWATPKFLAKNGEGANITMTTDFGDAYQITGGTSRVPCTNTNTVYYIENRQQTGYDQYLPGHGMLVWKVSYNASGWEGNDLNNTAGTLRYTIVPADGKTSNYGDAADPFPGTGGVHEWKPFTGCELTDIAETSGTITFKYNGGMQKTECSYSLLGNHCTVPADGIVNTHSSLSLTIVPDEGYTLAEADCWTVEMGSNNELVYGVGFTYNAETNEFRIEDVTDDVVILVEGKETYQITWLNQGEPFATTVTTGIVVYPAGTPDNCPSGKVFVGWTEQTDVDGTKPIDLFLSDEKTVTANTTYNAVFAAIDEENSEPKEVAAVTFNTYSSDSYTASTNIAELVNPDFEFGISAYSGTNVYKGKEGAKLGRSGGPGSLTLTLTAEVPVTKVIINASKYGSDTGNLRVTVGGTVLGTKAPASNMVFEAETAIETDQITIATTSKRAYIASVSIIGNSTSYNEYSLVCAECELTDITLNTDNVKKEFKQGEDFDYSGLVVTANFGNCPSKTVTGVVTAPDMTIPGTKEVIVSYTHKEVTVSASYQITMRELEKYTIRFFNNDTQIGASQTVTEGQQPEIPDNLTVTCDCEEYSFTGWSSEPHTSVSMEEPDYVNDFTATQDQDYYAIFTKTETDGSGTPAFDGSTSGTYRIYAKSGDTNYYATSTIKTNKITATTNVEEAELFQIDGNADEGFTIKTGDNYIAYGGSSTNVVAQSNPYKWNITASTAGYGSWRAAASTSTGRALVLRVVNASSQVFGAYSLNNNTFGTEYFDIEIGGEDASLSTTYYTSAPTCESILTGIDEVSSEKDKAIKIIENNRVVIIRDNVRYTILGQKIY